MCLLILNNNKILDIVINFNVTNCMENLNYRSFVTLIFREFCALVSFVPNILITIKNMHFLSSTFKLKGISVRFAPYK